MNCPNSRCDLFPLSMESFTIRSEDAEEILIQCQAQSKEVSLGLQFDSLVLGRLE